MAATLSARVLHSHRARSQSTVTEHSMAMQRSTSRHSHVSSSRPGRTTRLAGIDERTRLESRRSVYLRFPAHLRSEVHCFGLEWRAAENPIDERLLCGAQLRDEFSRLAIREWQERKFRREPVVEWRGMRIQLLHERLCRPAKYQHNGGRAAAPVPPTLDDPMEALRSSRIDRETPSRTTTKRSSRATSARASSAASQVEKETSFGSRVRERMRSEKAASSIGSACCVA